MTNSYLKELVSWTYEDEQSDDEEEEEDQDSVEEILQNEVEYIYTTVSNELISPITYDSGSGANIQKTCCCGIMHVGFNPEVTKHKCTNSGLKVFATFCLKNYNDETSSSSGPCINCFKNSNTKKPLNKRVRKK